MLRRSPCDLFGIDVPIILARMGTCASAEFAAAVSNAGGLGGIGSLFRSTAAVKRDIDVVRTLTSRPFAVNHVPPAFDAEAFSHTLEVLVPRIPDRVSETRGDVDRVAPVLRRLLMR